MSCSPVKWSEAGMLVEDIGVGLAPLDQELNTLEFILPLGLDIIDAGKQKCIVSITVLQIHDVTDFIIFVFNLGFKND
jgi:hypothetical protein